MKITKIGMWCICLLSLTVAACKGKSLQSGNQATLPPYIHFFKMPEQKNKTYPIVFESCGMMDFSATVIFEVDSEWVKDFVLNNELTTDASQTGILIIANDAKELKLEQISDVIDSNTWKGYEYRPMQFLSNGNTYRGYFELYTNDSETIAMIHLFSIQKANEIHFNG